MTLSLHRLTVPAYLRGLNTLARYLDHAAAHARANGSDPDALAAARLAPDMLPLAGQIQRASDTSKNAIARLLGTDPPRFADQETTLGELRERLEKTIAYVESADPAAVDAGAAREITLTFGPLSRRFDGEGYVLEFALPNFYFHLATAHAILRHAGVAIGKLDYLGAA
ncbi:MAG: DUF1993 domain-containing protein [Dokdonella sp.]|nr:DUF1993 domain-containing protein [Dokdonella sp.]